MEEASGAQNENEKTERLRRRLSSILKAPRAPLQDLGGGNERHQDHLLEKRRKSSRRVSFAETIEVRTAELQAKADGQIDDGGGTGKPILFEPGSTQNARCPIAGMDTLLHAPVQTRMEDADQTVGNKTVLFSGEDMNMTASNTILITRNLLDNSEAEEKPCKIDITSFIAGLSSKSKISKTTEDLTSFTQPTVAKSAFFNIQPKTSGKMENKINVDAFLASLKPVAKPVHAVLDGDDKENLSVFAVSRFNGRKSNNSLTINPPAYCSTQENTCNLTQIYKDDDDAIDLTRCHTTNIETLFANDCAEPFGVEDRTVCDNTGAHDPGRMKPEHGATFSTQKIQKDLSQSNAYSKSENKLIYPQVQNTTVVGDDEMDLTSCHTVRIDGTLKPLPVLQKGQAAPGTFFPGDQTMIFAEQDMDITRNDTFTASSGKSAGRPFFGSETSQRTGKAYSFPSENTVHFLGDDMDDTRSHTVAIDGQIIGQQCSHKQASSSVPESSVLTADQSHNPSNDGLRRHLYGSTVSEAKERRYPSHNGALHLQIPGDKTVVFSWEDMNLTGNVGSVEPSAKRSSRRPLVDKTVVFNESEFMEVTESHTVFIESQENKLVEKTGQADLSIWPGGNLRQNVDLKSRSSGAREMFGDKLQWDHRADRRDVENKERLQRSSPSDQTSTFTTGENDMDLTGEHTSSKNTHYEQEKAERAANILQTQNDLLELTQSHTSNIENVLPTGDQMAKTGNCSSSVGSSRKSLNALSSEPNKKVEEIAQNSVFNLFEHKKNTSLPNAAKPAFHWPASRSRDEEDMTTFHTATLDDADLYKQTSGESVAMPKLDRNNMGLPGDDANLFAGLKTANTTIRNSSSHLRAGKSDTVLYSAEDMDITKSHTVVIDGQMIAQSQNNTVTLQFVSDMDACMGNSRQETTTDGLGITSTGNVSHATNTCLPGRGGSLLIQLPSDKSIGFLDEDMTLTRVLSVDVDPKAVEGQYGRPSKKTGATSRKSLPLHYRPDSTILKVTEDMDMTESHTCYIEGQIIDVPVRQRLRSDIAAEANGSVAENMHPAVSSSRPSAEKILLGNSSGSSQLQQKEAPGMSVSFGKKTVIFGHDMDMSVRQPSVAIHGRDLGTVSESNVSKKFYACPSVQENTCNVTRVFREDNDDFLELTQCHTTNINSFVPADDVANSKLGPVQRKSPVFGDSMCHAPEGASARISSRRLGGESAIQHIGSEGYERSRILALPKEVRTLETTNLEERVNQDLGNAAAMTVNPAPRSSENCWQSSKSILFSSFDDMDMTHAHTVAIKDTGYYCTNEMPRRETRVHVPAEDNMDITRSHTVAIDQQTIGELQAFRLPPNNEKSMAEPKRDMLAYGEEIQSSEKYSFQEKKNEFHTSRGSTRLSQFPNNTVYLREESHVTEGFNPGSGSKELGRKYAPTFKHAEASTKFSQSLSLGYSSVTPALKGQQEMEMTASHTVFIDGPAVAIPVTKTHASENSRYLKTSHFLLNNTETSAQSTASGTGYESQTLCDVEMDITKCHTINIEKVNTQHNVRLDSGTATLPTGSRPRNVFLSFPAEKSLLSAGDTMDITRSHTVGIDQQIIEPPQSNRRAFQSLSDNGNSRRDPNCMPTAIDVDINSTGNLSSQTNKTRFQRSHGSSPTIQPVDENTSVFSEDMTLTRGCSVVTESVETRRPYGRWSGNAGTFSASSKLPPLDERSASSILKGNVEMEITQSHTVFIVDQHVELPEEHMGSRDQSKNCPEVEPRGLSTEQIKLNSDPAESLKLKPGKSQNFLFSPDKQTVFFEKGADMEMTNYTKAKLLIAGDGDLGTALKSNTLTIVEKAYTYPRMQENTGDVTLGMEMDDQIEATRCHTTRIESFVPVAHSNVLKPVENLFGDDEINKPETQTSISLKRKSAAFMAYANQNVKMEATQTPVSKNTSCLHSDAESATLPTASTTGFESKTLRCDDVMELQGEKASFYNEDEHCRFSVAADSKRSEPHVTVPPSGADAKSKLNVSLPIHDGLVSSTLKEREETQMDYENTRLSQRLERTGSDNGTRHHVNTHPVADRCADPQHVTLDDSIVSLEQQPTECRGIMLPSDKAAVSVMGDDIDKTRATGHHDLVDVLDVSTSTNRTGRRENLNDSTEDEQGFDGVNCNLKSPVLLEPSAGPRDQMQDGQKSRRASIANIQSKLERLKRQSEGGMACETTPVSEFTQRLPRSSPVSNDPMKLEACVKTTDAEINPKTVCPERNAAVDPSVACNSEVPESKRFAAGESTVPVTSASEDIVNTTSKVKRFSFGFFPAKLPNKRKSIVSVSADADGRPDPLVSESEMHANAGSMPDMPPAVAPVDVQQTCEPHSIHQETLCPEETEPHQYEVPEGAWEELCEKEALLGQMESGFIAPSPGHSQKRALEFDGTNDLQKEKKRKQEFEGAGDSAGKLMASTCTTNLSGSNMEVEANTISSTLAQSLLKNSSTSSADSRADGTTCSQADSRFLMDSSDEFNLHLRLHDGVITVKEFFMLLNIGALIQKPRFSEPPANYDANVHPTQEDLLRDQYIYQPKLQVFEEDCQALYQATEELKLPVSAQDKPLAKVNGLLWEAMRACSESELKLFGEEIRRLRSSYTLKSKVLSHKEKVTRYGKLLKTTQGQWGELQSKMEDIDRLLEETDSCISALQTESAHLEARAQDSLAECDSTSMAFQTELKSLQSSEDARHRELLSMEERRKSVLTQINDLQCKANTSDKHLEEYNFSEWEIGEWDEHRATFAFLYNSIQLSVEFGERVDGVLFNGRPCRRISEVNFESSLNDESAPPSSLLVQRLIFQFIQTKGPFHECYKTTCEMPQFLFDVSLVVIRCRLLGEELEFILRWDGRFNISKTEVHGMQVKLLFSSPEVVSKFEITFYLSDDYPAAPLAFTVLRRIGKIGQDEISAVLANVPQGPSYLTRAVKQIHRNLLQVPFLHH